MIFKDAEPVERLNVSVKGQGHPQNKMAASNSNGLFRKSETQVIIMFCSIIWSLLQLIMLLGHPCKGKNMLTLCFVLLTCINLKNSTWRPWYNTLFFYRNTRKCFRERYNQDTNEIKVSILRFLTMLNLIKGIEFR